MGEPEVKFLVGARPGRSWVRLVKVEGGGSRWSEKGGMKYK